MVLKGLQCIFWGYVGIMEKKMETIGLGGFCRDYKVYFGVM